MSASPWFAFDCWMVLPPNNYRKEKQIAQHGYVQHMISKPCASCGRMGCPIGDRSQPAEPEFVVWLVNVPPEEEWQRRRRTFREDVVAAFAEKMREDLEKEIASTLEVS